MPRVDWPPYRTVRDLIHRHRRACAVIMGGGETMPDGVARSPKDAIYISVNDHGVRTLKRHPALGRIARYVVACDKIEKRARFDIGKGGDGRPWGLPVISRHMWCDYRLLFMPGPSSAMAAAYVARLMGCAPIILTGMDLYAAGTYHDDPKANSPGKNTPPREHFARWLKFAAAFPAMYRVIGCHPLMRNRFAEYDPAEELEAPVALDRLEADIRGYFTKITKGCDLSMRPFTAGGTYEFCKAEFEKLTKMRNGCRASKP